MTTTLLWASLGVLLWAWLRRRRRRRRQRETMPKTWMAARARDDEKNGHIEFHGPTISWPINKRVNEASQFNGKRLRKRA